MNRKWTAFALAVVLAAIGVMSPVSAVTVDPSQRACLVKKYGSKVAAAITKAKKLTTAQAKQLASCPISKSSGGASGGTSGSGSAGSSGGAGASSSLTTLSWG